MLNPSVDTVAASRSEPDLGSYESSSLSSVCCSFMRLLPPQLVCLLCLLLCRLARLFFRIFSSCRLYTSFVSVPINPQIGSKLLDISNRGLRSLVIFPPAQFSIPYSLLSQSMACLALSGEMASRISPSEASGNIARRCCLAAGKHCVKAASLPNRADISNELHAIPPSPAGHCSWDSISSVHPSPPVCPSKC